MGVGYFGDRYEARFLQRLIFFSFFPLLECNISDPTYTARRELIFTFSLSLEGAQGLPSPFDQITWTSLLLSSSKSRSPSSAFSFHSSEPQASILTL